MTLSKIALDALCGIAEMAGAEILTVYDAGSQIWEKSDSSPLTEADLRADRVIRAELEKHFPGIFILSEESISVGESTEDYFFLVDPLDGTKEFIKRNGEFTVNIALVDKGRPVAGVVLAPALGELFFAAVGLGAWKKDSHGIHSISVATRAEGEPLRVIGSRSHGGEKLAEWLSSIGVDHSFVAAGSSLKFCRIAEGAADVYPRFGPTSQWDTAAAQCILEVAGGAVKDLEGKPLSYGLARPILNSEFIASVSSFAPASSISLGRAP